jgi:hypothetical protein
MRRSVASQVEEVSEEWTQSSYTGYDDTDAVLGVSPEDHVGDTICEELSATEVFSSGVFDSQRYSLVLVKFTVYTRRMQADKLALDNTKR